MLMCRDMAKSASEYIDGDLGMTKRLSIRMHLLMCRHCRLFVRNLRNSVALIQIHSRAQTDDDYIRRVNAEIGRMLADGSRPSRDP